MTRLPRAPARWCSGLVLMLALTALTGCSKSTATTADLHQRSDATLQSLATTAWSDAGYSGQTVTTVTASNASTVSVPVGDVIVQALQAIQSQHGVALATPLEALLGGPAVRPLSSLDLALNDTFNCPGGGSMGVTGTLQAGNDRTITSDETGLAYIGVGLTPAACVQSGVTFTGSLRYNANDRYTVQPTGPSTGTIKAHLDEYADGGLAITDGAAYYNPVFGMGTLGDLTVAVDNTSAVIGVSGNIVYTLKLDTITCATTVTFDGLLQRSNGSWTCS